MVKKKKNRITYSNKKYFFDVGSWYPTKGVINFNSVESKLIGRIFVFFGWLENYLAGVSHICAFGGKLR